MEQKLNSYWAVVKLVNGDQMPIKVKVSDMTEVQNKIFKDYNNVDSIISVSTIYIHEKYTMASKRDSDVVTCSYRM